LVDVVVDRDEYLIEFPHAAYLGMILTRPDGLPFDAASTGYN
jgi:hypothetical protein